jgi:hypothetical protein
MVEGYSFSLKDIAMRLSISATIMLLLAQTALAEDNPSSVLTLTNRWQYLTALCVSKKYTAQCVDRERIATELTALGYCYEEAPLRIFRLWSPCLNKVYPTK